MENKPSPIYFAIDSDVLRALTYLDKFKKENAYCDFSSSSNVLLKKFGGYINRLYNSIINDEIRPVIVDAVYQESRHSKSLLSFMKEYCYFPQVTLTNYQAKAEQARALAKLYNQPYTYRGVEYPAPMKMVFSADGNRYVPTNDCYIMAQATIEGVSLITANGKDFIFDEKESQINKQRQKGIHAINASRGYASFNFDNKEISPLPVHINIVGPALKNGVDKLISCLPFNEFSKGDELISNEDIDLL